MLDHGLRMHLRLRVGGELLHRRRPAEPGGVRAELGEDLLVGVALADRASGTTPARRDRSARSRSYGRFFAMQQMVDHVGELASRARVPRRQVRCSDAARARGRGRTLGGRALASRRARRRDDPPREAALDGRPGRGRPARGAARARLGARLGDERQDDDDGDGRRDPRRRARLQPLRARTCSRASPPPCSRRRTPSSVCSRSTRRRCPEVARRVHPRVVALGNLFRDQLDRYGELEHVAERWRGTVAGAARGDARRERRRPAPRRARPRPREHDRLRPRRPLPRPRVAPARGRLEVLPHLRHAVRVRRRLRRAPRRLPLPELPRARGAARRRRARDRAARPRRERVQRSRRPAGTARVRLALPGLYNVYNATAAAAIAGRARRAARRRSPPGSSASRPPSAASSGSRSATGGC